jgi:hypothetical protein
MPIKIDPHHRRKRVSIWIRCYSIDDGAVAKFILATQAPVLLLESGADAGDVDPTVMAWAALDCLNTAHAAVNQKSST